MNSSRLTDAEIRAVGWAALVDKLGVAGALRFSLQTEQGFGDYADRRHRLFGRLSVDELVKMVRKESRKRPRSRGGNGR